MKERSRFVDTVRITIQAGDGGKGCISFLRQKGQPHGGPDGGDGGRGGSVILQGDPLMGTLIDLKMRPHLVARNGQNGGGKNCSGRDGEDLVIKVPLGTVAVEADTEREVGEVTTDGQRLVIARGGDGGRGNQHFATATNKAPRKAEDGWPGDRRDIVLELKTIADAGLVGLPNAGKSTLLGALTNAHPEVAAYPFTTLSPNLGVFLTPDAAHRITVADIPGLVEGAHEGAGLGHRFLRHIERTRMLVHLVSPDGGMDAAGQPTSADATPETLLYAYDLVRQELASYSAKLLEKPSIVCLNKVDLMTPAEVATVREIFSGQLGIDLLPVSTLAGDGLDQLRAKIEEVVEALDADPPEDDSIDPPTKG